jgi:hypothetical protein
MYIQNLEFFLKYLVNYIKRKGGRIISTEYIGRNEKIENEFKKSIVGRQSPHPFLIDIGVLPAITQSHILLRYEKSGPRKMGAMPVSSLSKCPYQTNLEMFQVSLASDT